MSSVVTDLRLRFRVPPYIRRTRPLLQDFPQVIRCNFSLRENRQRLELEMPNDPRYLTRFRTWEINSPEGVALGQIQEAAKTRDFETAISVFQSLLNPNTHAYGKLLHAADRCNKLREAEELYSEMKDRLLPIKIGSFTSMISLNSRRGFSHRVEQLLEDMRTETIKPDCTVYSVILNGQAKHRCVDDAISTWDRMLAAGIQPSAVAFVSFLNVFSQAARPDLALKYLADMPAFALDPHVSHWNCVLKACQMKADGVAARRELQRMIKSCVSPNVVSFSSTLEAITRERASTWQADVDDLVSDMSAAGIAPDAHFVELHAVGLCGCSISVIDHLQEVSLDNLEEALRLLREAQKQRGELSPRGRRFLEALHQELAQRKRQVCSPEGQWMKVISEKHGTYYWNRTSGITQWERPTDCDSIETMQC